MLLGSVRPCSLPPVRILSCKTQKKKKKWVSVVVVVVAQFVYHATFIPMPLGIRLQVCTAIYTFVAVDRPADAGAGQLYPARDTCALPVTQGGIGLVAIQQQLAALQAKVIGRLMEPEQLPWKGFFDHHLYRSKEWLQAAGAAASAPTQQHIWQLGRHLIFSSLDLGRADLPQRVRPYIASHRRLAPHRIVTHPLCHTRPSWLSPCGTAGASAIPSRVSPWPGTTGLGWASSGSGICGSWRPPHPGTCLPLCARGCRSSCGRCRRHGRRHSGRWPLQHSGWCPRMLRTGTSGAAHRTGPSAPPMLSAPRGRSCPRPRGLQGGCCRTASSRRSSCHGRLGATHRAD